MADNTKIPRLIEEREIGRGFTKTILRRYMPADNSVDAIYACFEAAFGNIPSDFSRWCEAWKAWAEELLSRANLPNQIDLYYPESDPSKWRYANPATDVGLWTSDIWHVADLDHYILRILKKEHDGKDGIGFAARIITAIVRVDRLTESISPQLRDAHHLQTALRCAFEIGRLTAEVRSYNFSAQEGKKRKKPLNAAKQKAMLLVRELVRKNLTASETEIWTSFRGLCESRSDIFIADEDGSQIITIEVNSESWSCRKNSFLKVLLRPARKAETDDRA